MTGWFLSQPVAARELSLAAHSLRGIAKHLTAITLGRTILIASLQD